MADIFHFSKMKGMGKVYERKERSRYRSESDKGKEEWV
jgi:hypothetical protein